jgi:hypothetical protein
MCVLQVVLDASTGRWHPAPDGLLAMTAARHAAAAAGMGGAMGMGMGMGPHHAGYAVHGQQGRASMHGAGAGAGEGPGDATASAGGYGQY